MDQKYFFYFLIAVPFFGSADALNIGLTVAKSSNGFNVTFHFVETIVKVLSNRSNDFQTHFVACLILSYGENVTAVKEGFCRPLAKILIDMNKEGYQKISLPVKNEIKNVNPNINTLFTLLEISGHGLQSIAQADEDFYEQLIATLTDFLNGFERAVAGLNSATFRKLSDVALDEVQMAFFRGFNYTENEDENTTPQNQDIFPILGKQVSCLLNSESTQLADALFEALINEFKDSHTMKSKFFCPFGSTLRRLQTQFESIISKINDTSVLSGIKEFFELCGIIGHRYEEIVDEEQGVEEIREAISETYRDIAEFFDTPLEHQRTRLSKALLSELQDIIFNVLEKSQECPTLSVNIGLQQAPSSISGLLTAL